MDLNNLDLPPESKSLLQEELERLHRNYEDDIDNLIDAATEELERADPMEMRDLVLEYVNDADTLASEYYEAIRDAWQRYAGVGMPAYEPTGIDPYEVLYRQVGGFSGSDWNGLNYTQLRAGQSRAGLTVDDLWPRNMSLDDWQQFAADMIARSLRMSTQANRDKDPTHPRWARVPRGSRPCSFCVMLASNGFFYTSERSADFGGSFHNGKCKCVVVCSWGKDRLIGYDQERYRTMYDAAVKAAGSSDAEAVAVAMNHLYPDDVSGGVYELSKEWPDEVIRPRGQVWDHIFAGHGPGTRVAGKTHFPDDWPQEKVQWAVRETICAPDYEPMTTPDGMVQRRRKLIEGQIIEVYLKVKRKKKLGGRFSVNSAYPITEQERGRYGQ